MRLRMNLWRTFARWLTMKAKMPFLLKYLEKRESKRSLIGNWLISRRSVGFVLNIREGVTLRVVGDIESWYLLLILVVDWDKKVTLFIVGGGFTELYSFRRINAGWDNWYSLSVFSYCSSLTMLISGDSINSSSLPSPPAPKSPSKSSSSSSS